MIPILYDETETAFVSNGIGRLRDTIRAEVTEERNGIYELEFDVPVNGAHFDDIRPGRIVAVTHDNTGDVQPFDIVSYTKPINGIVTFRAVHVSYRQSGLTAFGTNINSLADAFTMLSNATPNNPFSYSSDFTSGAYFAAADGTPRTVRQFLGGVEGSILDSYGGEFLFDKFSVSLLKNRGVVRDFVIRYGVNMTDYEDETDYSGAFSSCIPYWTGTDNSGNPVIVRASRVDSGQLIYGSRNICAPLDLTDKFETKPTTSQLRTLAASMMSTGNTYLPAQTIRVSFVNLADVDSSYSRLFDCQLCDSVNVTFPAYGMNGLYKIVKVVYNVLEERYLEMELGTLSTTLADALGVGQESLSPMNGGGGTQILPAVYFDLTLGSASSLTSGEGHGTFDPNTGLVTISGSFYASGNNFPMSTAAFTVPAAYRPTATVRLPSFMLRSTIANCRPLYMILGTSGNITQTFSSALTGAFFSGSYVIPI